MRTRSQDQRRSLLHIHDPLIQHIIPLLPLPDVLSLSSACHSLRNTIKTAPADIWKEVLSSWLPAGHFVVNPPKPILPEGPSAPWVKYRRIPFSPASYFSTQRSLWRGQYFEWCECRNACVGPRPHFRVTVRWSLAQAVSRHGLAVIRDSVVVLRRPVDSRWQAERQPHHYRRLFGFSGCTGRRTRL